MKLTMSQKRRLMHLASLSFPTTEEKVELLELHRLYALQFN